MRYLLTLSLAGVVIGLTALIHQPPLVSRPTVALYTTQAVDPNNPAHKVRPDGRACQATGKDACACAVSSCSHDEQGHVTSWHASSQCQWFCHQDKCTCHPCVEDGDCPDGSGGREP